MLPTLALLLALTVALAKAPLPPLPWHLADVSWILSGETAGFESLSVEFSLDRDMPADDFNLYVAPVGLGTLNGVSFYGGLQTNIRGYPAANPSDHSGRSDKGKGGIFSRWGRGLNLSFVRPAPDGYVEAADYEGDFVSGRRPYPWKAGAYVFELRKLDSIEELGKPWTWVGAFVTDKASGKRVSIAALKFPGKELTLGPEVAAFVEFYGGKDVDISRLPPLELRFSRPRINGKPVSLRLVGVHHPSGSAVAASPAIMTVELSSDGTQVVAHLHDKILADRSNHYILWPKPAR